MTIIVDLTAEAEIALRHIKSVTGDTSSRIIDELLVKHDATMRES